MNNDLLALAAKHIRATDSNSLLRLYDQASDACRHTLPRQVRERVARTIARIVQELHKRAIPLSPAPG